MGSRPFFYTRDVGAVDVRLFFVQSAALAEALASFSGFRSFRILLPRAPSTITQYEYYSPLSPGSVQESLLGCPAPPCVLFFLRTRCRRVGYSFFSLNAALA